MRSIKTLYKIGHGPSSSHTMGPAFASQKIKALYKADRYEVTLYNSLALTGHGHLTDKVIKDILGNVSFKIAIDKEEHPNLLIYKIYKKDVLLDTVRVVSVGGGDIIFNDQKPQELNIYPHTTFNEIKAYCKAHKWSLIQYILHYEDSDFILFLEGVLNQMEKTILNGLSTKGLLPGTLEVQRKANVLYQSADKQVDINLKQRTLLSSYAFATNEENASGNIVVTAPTCGASGTLPAVLYYAYKVENFKKDKIIEALAIAGLFGNLIRKNATISGAIGGCQAEVGSACSMAAAAYAYLKGETIEQIEYAAEIAMEHHLGLTCDPIGGYVQMPCIERNAVASLRAINASELSLILFETRKISFDMIVKTMYQTGLDMDSKYKETSEAGMATIYKELNKW